jgi:uncharacterized protein YbbC (DUF1343 family)
MKPIPGILTWLELNKAKLKGKRLAIICNQASVIEGYQHILFYVMELERKYGFQITAVFGPQHGIWGHTQDNMIEWESYHDERFPFPFYSLYGNRRDIPEELLEQFDILLFDIQDVGARYYTFIWSLAMVMKSVEHTGIQLVVSDRPNPINGVDVEGPVLNPAFSSFVGLHPLPVRHGMTVGEIALYFRDHFYPEVRLEIARMKDWDRRLYLDDYSNYPWVLPSPNMPLVETAVVYPGMCLLEGTNISEGRGTTRPFEIFGAPFLNGIHLCEYLNNCNIPGVYFSFFTFQPTFNKFQGQPCEGAFIHVLDRTAFKPVFSTLHIFSYLLKQFPDQFQWKQPPYEYEYQKLPIDILFGTDMIRKELEKGTPPQTIEEMWKTELAEFEKIRKEYLLYENNR